MKEEYVKILEYIRVNKRPENDDIKARFGEEGLWTLSVFRGRCSDVRQKEGLTAMRNKRDEIIDNLKHDIISGNIKTLNEIRSEIKERKTQNYIWSLIIAVVLIVAAIALLFIGGAAILIIPSIWIIVILLIYIAKKV